MENLKVKDMMTKEPLSVGPDDLVVYAAKILTERNFNGLPVVDKDRKLAGIITEYDLISRSDSMHLPTLIKILSDVGVYKKDTALVKDDLKKMLSLKVRDIMNTDPLTVNENAPIQELADLFAHHHRVNPIPVIDNEAKLVGIVSRFDLVRMFVDEKSHQNVKVSEPEILDKRVDGFIDNFEKRFVFVSRTRTKLWLIVSFLFAVVGFIIAFAIILRITTK